MNIRLTKQAQKFWENLDKKQQQQISQKSFSLIGNPRPHDSESLVGAKNGGRRVDVGEYRIIYTHDTQIVEILVIGKRNDDEAYSIWKQMVS